MPEDLVWTTLFIDVCPTEKVEKYHQAESKIEQKAPWTIA
jgi:hypothetical protein